MHCILLFCSISVILSVSSGDSFKDDDGPGDALYLTKYIESGDIATAQHLSLVSHPDIRIENYAGYFTVNKEYNSNLFFWFFPAKFNTADAPVVLWLQGGPGASSFSGLFNENGPFHITAKQQLIPRKYSWHLNHNLIYIDNPAGTGFSFTDSDDGYAKNHHDVGESLLNALQQFFLLFPNLQKNEFFVTGESFAGKYIPSVGFAIYQDRNRRTDDNVDGSSMPKINLKGLAIGNGLVDPLHQFIYSEYLYQLGLIDANGRRAFIEYENQQSDCIKKRDFECAYEIFDKMINMHQYPQGSLFKNLTGFQMYFNYLETKPENNSALLEFLQKTETRRAIHVGNNTFHRSGGGNTVENHLKLEFMDSVASLVANLLSHYPILIYNGQFDIIAAYPMMENYVKHLNFTGAEQYKDAPRFIWRVDNEIAGYAKHGGNLTTVLVRNAGHRAPKDQPKWVLDMLLRFTHHKGFH